MILSRRIDISGRVFTIPDLLRLAGILDREVVESADERAWSAEPRLTGANQEWAMVFIVEGLATGRMVRILSVLDAYAREWLALVADTSLRSGRVTRVLERLIGERGRPENVRSDNGPSSHRAA